MIYGAIFLALYLGLSTIAILVVIPIQRWLGRRSNRKRRERIVKHFCAGFQMRGSSSDIRRRTAEITGIPEHRLNIYSDVPGFIRITVPRWTSWSTIDRAQRELRDHIPMATDVIVEAER